MKIKSLISAGIIAAASIGFSSCNSSNSSGPTSPVYTDIVTVTQFTDNSSVFTFQQLDDSPLITLRSSNGLNAETVKIGDRMLLSYQTDGAPRYQNADINIVGAALTYGKGGDFEKATAESTGNFISTKVYNAEGWRSGIYLNFGFTYSTDRAPKTCKIVVDEATIDDEYPQLYFIFEPEPLSASSQPMVYYMSYTFADLFNRPTCRGVKLNYTVETGKQSVTFDNINQMIKPIL